MVYLTYDNSRSITQRLEYSPFKGRVVRFESDCSYQFNEPLSERLGGGLQNRLDWLDSSTALQNTMIKYILIETILDKTQNPYWYPGVGRQEEEFMEITRTSVVTFASQENLAE